MAKMSDEVRLLVGLENLLLKARRRHRECEREAAGSPAPRAKRYAELIARLSEEIHSTDQSRLEEYLSYVEQSLLPRIATHVEATKDEMLEAAKQMVDARGHLMDLRTEYTDALERIRSVRERLGLDPFKPLEARFGVGPHPPNADRRVREAHGLMKDFLKS